MKSERLSSMPPAERESMAANGRNLRAKSANKPRPSITSLNMNERMSINSRSNNNYSEVRNSINIGSNLRPNIPSNKSKF